MTPDRLANFVSLKLSEIHPPGIDFHPGDPIAACDWINRFCASPTIETEIEPRLGDWWPQLPGISANHYSLARAPQPDLLYTHGCGPVSFCNGPGRDTSGDALPALARCQQVAGHVIACNGAVAFSRTDFVFPGPIPFQWQRHYRQHQSGETAGAWRHSLDEYLQIDQGGEERQPGAALHTADGRRVAFTLPAIGHSSFNRFERLLLHRQSLHSFRLLGFGRAAKTFRADGTGQSLPLTEIRDPSGNTLTIDYYRGQPSRIVSSWGRALEFEYSGDKLVAVLDRQAPEGTQRLCHYEYSDSDDQLLAAQGLARRETYHYDDTGRLAAISSGGNRAITFSYDGRQRCNRLQVDGLEYRLHWSRSQQACRLERPGEDAVHWKFNACGQLLREQQGEAQQRFFYDHYGNLCQVSAADGRREIFRSDEFGRLLRRSCDGASDRYLYDADGLLQAAQRRGEQSWHYHYNEAALLREIVDPSGARWCCSYDSRGLLEELTDPEGGRVALHWDGQAQLRGLNRGDRRWALDYNHWQQLCELTVDDEAHGRWQYDEHGQLHSAQLAGASLALDYDDSGNPCRIRCDEKAQLQWQRDSAGRICAITFAGGEHWNLDYDHCGRPSQLHTGSDTFTWRYDRFGRATNFDSDDGFHRQWQYRHSGQLSEYRDGDSHWYLSYDSAGQLQRVRNNSGQQCEFHYDRHGRLIQASNEHSHLRFQYDSRGLLLAEHCDGSDGNQLSVNHRYDTRGWLRDSSSDSLDVGCLFAPGGDLYGVDANGESVLRIERDGSRQTHHRGDNRCQLGFRLGRLATIELSPELAWELPNRDRPDLQLAQVPRPPHAVQWDKRGNVVREFRPGKRSREYFYQHDGWGLMSSAECGDFKTLFRYDPFGRRLAKITTHRRSSRKRRLLTQWTATGLWRERALVDDAEKATWHYLHHPVDGSPVARLGDGALEHFVADACGNLLALIDASGDLLWRRDSLADDSPRQGPGNYRGNEGLFDGETGLFYQRRGYHYAGVPLAQSMQRPPTGSIGDAPETGHRDMAERERALAAL